MKSAARTAERGFSLVEVTVALLLSGVLAYTLFSVISQLSDSANRHALVEQQSGWKKIFTQFAEQHFVEIATDDGQIETQSGITLTVTPTGLGKCGTSANKFAVSVILGEENDRRQKKDPWGGDWCVLSGAVTSVLFRAHSVKIRPLAMFSEGITEGFQTTLAKTSLKCPVASAGDTGFICVPVVSIAKTKMDDTVAKMEHLVEIFESYAENAAAEKSSLAHSSINYFYNVAVATTITVRGQSQDDTVSPFAKTEGGAAGEALDGILTDSDFQTEEGDDVGKVLGISRADVIDGFGGIIYLDNNSEKVKTPNANEPPPYNARLIAKLPGGDEYVRFINNP